MTTEPRTPHLAPETPELVWFRGPDTIRFLNNIISQEIANLAPGSVTRSLLLEPQGKLDHILWVLRGDDEVGLITDPDRGEELVGSLGRYRIRVDVEMERPEEPAWLVVGDWPVERRMWRSTGDGVVADLSWNNLRRAFLTGIRPDLPEMSSEVYEAARIAAGEPRWGADVDESTIPHASGLVPATVDLTKGCFLGQELVARIDSRGGNVPKRLRLLELGESAAERGARVSVDGDEVGTVTSRSGPYAMAVIKRGVEPGDEVSVGGVPAQVRDLGNNR